MKKIIIGVTGPTGAGKSSFNSVAEEMGFCVIDCDKYARIAVEKGTKGLKALINAFGEDILLKDESLNRKALAKKAFSTKENTELLNKTVLPFIKELIFEKIEKETKVLLDAPTLFESGINSVCLKTVAVLAEREVRLKRIIERDGITEHEALLRINAGKKDDFYIKNADFIIYNNSNNKTFIDEFKKLLTNIL